MAHHEEVADLMAENTRLRNQMEATAVFFDVLGNTLDEWAEQSRKGGWSTHQVEPNIARANDCRRQAAHLRSFLAG